MRTLALFSPALVLLVWAGFVALGCTGVVITAGVFVFLAVAVGFHFRTERNDHHAI